MAVFSDGGDMGVEVSNPAIPSVLRLQEILREMPQLELPTTHHFADGMYARVVARPAGALIVGRVHKKEHFYIVASGRVAVTDGEELAVEYPCGTVLVSKPGTKRAVLALEDSVCLTVHRTDKTTPEEIEDEVVETEDNALFDARNQLRLAQ
jgi:hypothetical protein